MKHIFSIVAISTFGAALMFSLNSALMLPDVYTSYSTNECVKVVNYDISNSFSCDNLPTKYHHVWVK